MGACGRAAARYGEGVATKKRHHERGSFKRAFLGLSLGVLLGVGAVAVLMTALVLLVLWYLNAHGT